jgi:DNA-binding CsgD family transcriptional regulator
MSNTTEACETAWFASALDQIDYGIVLVDGARRALYVNRAGRHLLDSARALRLRGGVLEAVREQDGAGLRAALHGALHKGLRTLLSLGAMDARSYVSVMALDRSVPDRAGVALLVAGRCELSDVLPAQNYARSHGLTATECQVMRYLCGGSPASEIARRQGVAISTIRTQIGSIRAKTGARNVGALVQQVALLPPMPLLLAPEATA